MNAQYIEIEGKRFLRRERHLFTNAENAWGDCREPNCGERIEHPIHDCNYPGFYVFPPTPEFLDEEVHIS